MTLTNSNAEWLETDGSGGFTSGTVSGERTRRYHALLLVATTPPTGRVVLVNGCEAWVTTPAGTFAISSQRYTPDVVCPDGAARIESFASEPWPRWVFRLEDGTRIEQQILMVHGSPLSLLAWRLVEPQDGVTLTVRPLLSGRDYHCTHHENPSFRFEAALSGERVTWQPYADLPAVISATNGRYDHDPSWFRNFLYVEEQARGLDATEDLASPGTLDWDLSSAPAVWMLTTDAAALGEHASSVERFGALLSQEAERRRNFRSPLDRAADAYLVNARSGKTIIAGYPWFTDWGRDTFIALRGLCLATGRYADARAILLAWSGAVSAGMLPNRFPDHGGEGEYNSVDASLWYIVAVGEFLQACDDGRCSVEDDDRGRLQATVEEILAGYSQGTRYGIRLDGDHMLACGEPGVQLTWMDVKIGEWVVTPRTGKPVEIQALWLNALSVASRFSAKWQPMLEAGRDAFGERFWNVERGLLYDVIDVDHQSGRVDGSFRPNQIFAVGGLPLSLVGDARARQVVDAVEAQLWTPLGLRSLAPGEPGYAPHYSGPPRDRDSVYHQGTVWPWLLGPFVEAWVRVRGGSAAVQSEARQRFVEPMLAHLNEAGLGHVSEIADAEPPHTPRGCPFQAWSLGELIRLEREILADAF